MTADPTGRDDESAPIARGAAGSVTGMVARGGGSMVLARLLRTLLTVLGMLVLARLLTPADFGIVAITNTLTVLSLVILEGAIDFPTLRRDALSRDAAQSMIWITLLFLVPFAAVIYAVAPAIEAALGFPDLGWALRGVIPVFFLQVFFVSGGAILRRQHRFKAAALVSVGSVGVYMSLAVGLAILDHGVWSIIIAQNLALLVTAIVLARLASISLRWPRRLSFAAVGRVGAYGAGSRVLAWFWSSIDTIAVGVVLGPAAVGLYARAYNISLQLKEPFTALDGPTRQAMVAVRNRDGNLVAPAVQMLRLLTIVTAAAAALCVVLRQSIVLILLGDQWQASAPALAILVLGLPARIGLMFFDGLAATAGSMPNMMLRHALMCGVVGSGVFLAAPHGIVAVAAVVSGAMYLALLLPARAAERALTGGRLMLLSAMVPGLLLGAALLAIGEFVLVPLAAGNLLAALAIVLPVYGVIAVLIGLALPNSWLPGALPVRRATLLRRFGAAPQIQTRG